MKPESTQAGRDRYSSVAMALHWIIALLIIADLIIGLDFADPLPGQRFSPKPWLWLHVSIGITVLALSIARLAWRITHRPPPHPADMNRWERMASNVTHVAFYGLMIGMPLSGWLVISAHKVFPFKTYVWKLIELPMLPFFSHLPVEQVETWHHRMVSLHTALAQYLLIAMLALHVLAVVKHHLFDNDPVMRRMLPRFGKAAAPASSTDAPLTPLP